MDCPKCFYADVEWHEIVGCGRLITFSTVFIPPTGFEDYTPYTVGVVEFSEQVRVFGWISREIPLEDVRIGMQLKVSPHRLKDEGIIFHFEKT